MSEESFITSAEIPHTMPSAKPTPQLGPVDFEGWAELYGRDLSECYSQHLARVRVHWDDHQRFALASYALVEFEEGVVLIQKTTGKVCSLIGSAPLIWKGLQNNQSFAEILDNLIDYYDVSPKLARRDLGFCLRQLQENGLLQPIPALLEWESSSFQCAIRIHCPAGPLAVRSQRVFRPTDSTESFQGWTVHFSLAEDQDLIPIPPSPRQPAEGSAPMGYCYGSVNGLQFRNGTRFHFDSDSRTVEGYWCDLAGLSDPEIDEILLCVFEEIHRHQGAYALHASALERNGRAVLFAGNTGSGKSTAALALLGQGFRLISDDNPFLLGDTLELTGFSSGQVKAAPESWRLLELQPDSSNEDNKQTATFPVAPGNYPVQAIFFPHIDQGLDSRLERLSPMRALEALLACSFLGASHKVVGEGLRNLEQLSRSVPAYRLFFGRQPQRLVERVCSQFDQ